MKPPLTSLRPALGGWAHNDHLAYLLCKDQVEEARKGARVEPQESQGNACRADALAPLLATPGEALVGGFPLLHWPELSFCTELSALPPSDMHRKHS